MTYIAIEGGVCSGKSTLLAGATLRLRLPPIPEYMEMLSPDHEARKTLLEPCPRLRLFLDLEQQRMNLIKSIRQDLLVADRCILTILAFEYAVNSLKISKTALPRLALRSSCYVAIPDFVLFLDISSELRLLRWCNRGWDDTSIFVRDDFNAAIRTCFERTSTIIETQFLDAGTLGKEEVIGRFVSLVSNHPRRNSIVTLPLRTLIECIFQ